MKDTLKDTCSHKRICPREKTDNTVPGTGGWFQPGFHGSGKYQDLWYYRRVQADEGAGQFVFERQPDAVALKRAQAGAPANWVRLWSVPVRLQGQPVFVAQVGRPVGGRFLPEESNARRLHPDVDEARNLFVQDMMYSGGLERLGFVTGVGAVSRTQPRVVANGASYYTDGLRAVLFFATRPLTLSDVQLLDWEPLLDEREPTEP